MLRLFLVVVFMCISAVGHACSGCGDSLPGPVQTDNPIAIDMQSLQDRTAQAMRQTPPPCSCGCPDTRRERREIVIDLILVGSLAALGGVGIFVVRTFGRRNK